MAHNLVVIYIKYRVKIFFLIHYYKNSFFDITEVFFIETIIPCRSLRVIGFKNIFIYHIPSLQSQASDWLKAAIPANEMLEI